LVEEAVLYWSCKYYILGLSSINWKMKCFLEWAPQIKTSSSEAYMGLDRGKGSVEIIGAHICIAVVCRLQLGLLSITWTHCICAVGQGGIWMRKLAVTVFLLGTYSN
jgi:hypothetical protein